MSKHKVTTVIQGTPFEAGAGVWDKLVLPCFAATKGQPPKHVQQFYAGLLTACMGAMAADFGMDRALVIVRTLADKLEGMGDELPGSRMQ